MAVRSWNNNNKAENHTIGLLLVLVLTTQLLQIAFVSRAAITSNNISDAIAHVMIKFVFSRNAYMFKQPDKQGLDIKNFPKFGAKL